MRCWTPRRTSYAEAARYERSETRKDIRLVSCRATAETLWTHVDEPIVNRHFDTLADLDAVVAERCVVLGNDRDLIRGQAGFHWWPDRVVAN